VKCSVDIQKDLYAKVVLLGGTTIFQGIGEHMKTYEPPDENIINVCAKRFRCAEALLSHQPDYHEVSRSHPQEVVRQCRALKRHDRAPSDY